MNGDVCRLLNIRKRTLQHYRDTGVLLFTQIGHKPLFAGELFLTGKEVCEWLYISPRTLQDYRDKKIIPYTQFAGKILYKASDLERMLEENYK